MLLKPADEKEQNALYSVGWAVAALLLAGGAAVRIFDLPVERFVLPCVLKKLTGLYCPGCGGTRAVLALLRGDLLCSLYCHPLVLYAAVLGAWFLASNLAERLLRRRVRIGLRYRHIYAAIAVGLMIAGMLFHNILKFGFGIIF